MLPLKYRRAVDAYCEHFMLDEFCEDCPIHKLCKKITKLQKDACDVLMKHPLPFVQKHVDLWWTMEQEGEK
jgi:hypothetical protein